MQDLAGEDFFYSPEGDARGAEHRLAASPPCHSALPIPCSRGGRGGFLVCSADVATRLLAANLHFVEDGSHRPKGRSGPHQKPRHHCI